jgi:23S rRNA (adenine2503-C2)-methyltransferase
LDAAKHYSDQSRRRVTYEYALIKGVNDSLDSAVELARRLKNSLCHVNLIAVNETKNGRRFQPSDAIQAFADCLRGRGVETTIRRRLGSDISAACGQLLTQKNQQV